MLKLGQDRLGGSQMKKKKKREVDDNDDDCVVGQSAQIDDQCSTDLFLNSVPQCPNYALSMLRSLGWKIKNAITCVTVRAVAAVSFPFALFAFLRAVLEFCPFAKLVMTS